MKKLFLLSLCLFSYLSLQGQGVSIFDKVQSTHLPQLTITMPWKELEKKKKEKQYTAAHLGLVTGQDSIKIPLKVRTRGNMRLNICSYPPLKLKFDKAILSELGLSDNNEMDLVHPCHDDELFDQLILREFLAYKLFQELSPAAYEAHLVNLQYLNPDGTAAHSPTTAFVVENCEELVWRLQGKRSTTATMSQQAIDREAFLRVCLFQYMIGNTDWNVKNRHNLEFILLPGYSFLLPVPYDFDYAGLVNAPYAAHHESIKLPSVNMRYYQGRCVTKAEAEKVINEFLTRKERLFAICHEIPGLNERSIKHVTGYLQDFFDIIENPKKTEAHILQHCDRWPADQ